MKSALRNEDAINSTPRFINRARCYMCLQMPCVIFTRAIMRVWLIKINARWYSNNDVDDTHSYTYQFVNHLSFLSSEQNHILTISYILFSIQKMCWQPIYNFQKQPIYYYLYIIFIFSRHYRHIAFNQKSKENCIFAFIKKIDEKILFFLLKFWKR